MAGERYRCVRMPNYIIALSIAGFKKNLPFVYIYRYIEFDDN